MRINIQAISALLLATTISVLAAPNPNPAGELEARNFSCQDKLVVSLFSKYESIATPLCSSFLSIPVKTSTNVIVSQIFQADAGRSNFVC